VVFTLAPGAPDAAKVGFALALRLTLRANPAAYEMTILTISTDCAGGHVTPGGRFPGWWRCTDSRDEAGAAQLCVR
jgi:hypothetical protein